ncbi:FLYWCH-type domain-containing protein [Aphis craccivora]|uniref:FLYWCH-type domain-containing protein n=1 Tax=Aphis craccivora TaxID=307492 RepID=A0A6G0YJM5_APHCR|nr:FLYWCH-type domain-containing protein [Aphis craccivora]
MDDEIQVYTNNKGTKSVIYQNYAYRIFRTDKNSGDLVWRCNNKLCSVMVTTNASVSVFIKQNKNEHNHENNEINSDLKEIRCAIKRESQLQYLYEKPLKIMRQELCMSSVSADNIDAMRQSMYRERRKLLLPVPVSLLDALNKIKGSNIALNNVRKKKNIF